MKPEFVERVQREIAAGRHWRAKQTLSGALANDPCEPALLELYGRVLLGMHDDLEAGRYLFASGNRLPEYAPAIDLFLNRLTKTRPQDAFWLLPAGLRRQPTEQWPQSVQEELSQRGLLELMRRQRRVRQATAHPRLHSRLFGLGCLILLTGLLLCAAIGAKVVVSWLVAMFGQ